MYYIGLAYDAERQHVSIGRVTDDLRAILDAGMFALDVTSGTVDDVGRRLHDWLTGPCCIPVDEADAIVRQFATKLKEALA